MAPAPARNARARGLRRRRVIAMSSCLPDPPLCGGIPLGIPRPTASQPERPTMKKLLTLLALGLTLGLGNAYAADDGGCAAKAAEKKLAGAAKASFEKKCMADAAAAAPASSPACEKSAADKKLAGAAKKSHIKKCMADEAGAAKPAASASAAKK